MPKARVPDTLHRANTADYGGGLCLANEGNISINKGKINNNTANKDGGGVYLDNAIEACHDAKKKSIIIEVYDNDDSIVFSFSSLRTNSFISSLVISWPPCRK